MQSFFLFISLLVILTEVKELLKPAILRCFKPAWHEDVDGLMIIADFCLAYLIMGPLVQYQLAYQGIHVITLINRLASGIVIYQLFGEVLIRLFGGLRTWFRLKVQALRRKWRKRQASHPTKTYFSLASPSPSQDPKGFFWLIMALFTTMLVIGMAALLLGCGKSRPAPTAPTVVVQRDTTRDRLKRTYDRATEYAQAQKATADSTQKPYENVTAKFDSLLGKLGL